ncbi:hypothetical protein Pla52o_06070 [Novipirellula galeiformis]|uniref:Protochlamydia outer membrane protein domain-containing protein n=1 Tax=Novipirellula galeiformis TaxID=2528004 RepID=A0A5C6CP51_9BACT|nr:hypothetical protein [Novipirellula galeiformis]TWU26753.1 hypothetical protein Pla52o_06070 [Novipirellula galeiformis]
MSRAQSFVLILVCLAATSSHRQVRAEWYADVDSGAMFINAPDFQYFAKRGETAPFERIEDITTDDGEDFGAFVGGKAGWIFDGSLLGTGNMRLEFSGSYAGFDDNTAVTFFDPGPGVRYGFVALDNTTGFGTADPPSQVRILHTVTSREIDFGGYDLLLHQDFRVDENRVWTLYGGPSVQHLYQEFMTHASFPLDASNTEATLNEALDTDYIGGKVGVSGRRNLNSRWSLFLDGNTGIYHAKTHYDGRFIHSTSFPPHDDRISLERHDHAVSTQARLDLTRQMNDFAFISLTSNVQHIDYAGQMNYGTRNDNVPSGSRLSIDRDELFSATVGLRLTIFR